MKIAISTIGSTGDVQPYLALSLGLRDAGHDVKVISHPLHEARFAQYDIPFAACGPEVTQEVLNEMLDKMLSTKNPVKQLKLLMEEAFFAEGEKFFTQAKAAFADREIALCHMVDFLGSEAAAQLDIPRIGGILAPAGIPTAYSVPPNFPNLGRWINPMLWGITNLVLKIVDRSANRYVGNLVEQRRTKVKGFHILSDELNLIAASPTLAPTYPDLPSHFKVTGPWFLQQEVVQPKQELVDFIAKHPQPVIVSFGSMGGSQGPALTDIVLKALKLTGRPAVIQSGYAGLFAENTPSNIIFADFVSHEWLFPHAACVVHHCGAGTTSAVAKAAVPHVPVTFIADQPYFAKQAYDLGIAVKKQWYFQISPESLAKRIDEACNNPIFKQNAVRISHQIKQEDGIPKAIALIEEHFEKVFK